MYKRQVREWLTLELREPWEVGGKTYKAGSLLATNFDDFMAGKREDVYKRQEPDDPELKNIGDAREVINMQQVYRRGEAVWRGPGPYR